jgi:ubiquinol-cytochrome c reductase cytochrome c subunit
MKVSIVLMAFMAAAAVATAQAPGPQTRPATPPAPAGNADNGKKLFVSYGCYQCHGYEAQGSSATGPRLGPRPIAFAAIVRYVRAPTGQMPPYTEKVLPEKDLADIYAFLQSRPAPKPVDSIPLLK